MTTKKLIVFLVLLFSNSSFSFGQTTPPAPAAPRSVEFPTPTEKTLPNGLRVIVIERHDTPLITASLVIKNGGEVDPTRLAGVADMTANLLTRGTSTRTATQIAAQIEGLGGMLDSAAQWDATSVSLEVMTDKIAPALEILADVVRRPTFRFEEIERLRQQYIDTLTLSLDEPSSVARFVGAKVLYGDGLYGHPILGTLQSLKLISRVAILRVHRTYYRPDNALLVVGGDINPVQAFSLATKYFGDWVKPKLRLPVLPVVANSANHSGRVVVIDKPDAGQAAVFLVRRGIDRKDADYYNGIVTNSVLSGYSGRLNQEVRIKRGLSYGAGSVLEARRDVGPFVASAQTRNESSPEVAALLKEEVDRLSTAPLVETELTPRKAALIGEFSRNLETVNGLVSRVSSLALYGLSLDEINHFIQNVEAVDPVEVQKFASTKLDARGADVIIVGDAKTFLPELRNRFSKVELIPFSRLDLNTRTLQKSSRR